MKKYYKRYLILFIIGIVANVVVDYVQLFIPEFLGDMVDIVSLNTNVIFDDIKKIVYSLIIVAFTLFIGRIIMRFTILVASAKIDRDIRHDMFLKTERLSQRYFHENKVGSIMSSFTTDIEAIGDFTGWGTVMIIDALFLGVMALYKMIRLDMFLTMITLIPMLALIVWGNKVEKAMSDKWTERQKSFDKLFDFTQENFTGIRVIKAFVKEAQEFKAFSKVAKENSDVNIDFAMMSVRFDVCIELLIGAVVALLMGLGGTCVYYYVTGNPVVLFGHSIILTAGKLVTFIGYVDVLIWPMIAMGQILQMFSRFKSSSKRVFDYLDEEEEIHNVDNPISLDDCKGEITFNHFSFIYPDGSNESLKDISFKINPGELIGVVGKIGSGKTTLVNSLLRLYNIEKNQILIDGVDIMDLDIKNLRDNIAYVPQDNFLFSSTVQENIAFSNKRMSIDKVKSAANFADVHENITNFKDGYNTMTGERGVTLSGGQKQRISIARAYAKDAPIMIMDDSVSAVDVKTEEAILSNIQEKRAGKTTIIIASRISTVSKADRILVLKDGELEAFDSPENLLKVSPTYQKMVYLQKLESEL